MKVTNGGFTFGFTLIAGIRTRELFEGTALDTNGWKGLTQVSFDFKKYQNVRNITKKTYESILTGLFCRSTHEIIFPARIRMIKFRQKCRHALYKDSLKIRKFRFRNN